MNLSRENIIKKFDRAILGILRPLKRELDYVYNEEFASTPYCNKVWADDFCGLIMRTFKPASIIDIGCGTADILAPFEKRGVDVLGIDGSRVCRRHSRIKQDNFLLFDLRKPYQAGRKFDLCLCMEVAEHIEDRYSDTLIRTVAGLSGTIIFTAAPPGQAGPDHINLKPYGYWIEKFKRRGFALNEKLAGDLKNGMKSIAGLHPWYFDNLMVFTASSGHSDPQ